jgi:hypothetical protein
MKTLDAAIIKYMAEAISRVTMLATMRSLCIRFIQAYISKCLWVYTTTAKQVCNPAYARKRIANRTIHDRKFALFTKNPNSRAGLFGIR